MKRAASVLATVALLAAGLVPAFTSTAGTASASVTHSADPAPGTRLWVQKFTGGAGHRGFGTSLAASPDNPIDYVTGETSATSGPARDAISTLAYSATTGATLWHAHYRATAYHSIAIASPYIKVSPDGSTVFVALDLRLRLSGWTYLVLAYNATTGALLWSAKPSAIASSQMAHQPLAVSPDSSTVYVTGAVTRRGTGRYTTVAFNAGTGAQDWIATAQFEHASDGLASAITASPDGSAVFVTGHAGTVAYAPTTGAELWKDRYKGEHGDPAGIVVSPDSSTVYVTMSGRSGSQQYWLTTADDAATGTQVWAAEYTGPGDGAYLPRALVATPDGSQVIVTGDQIKTGGYQEYQTVAYDAASGTQDWAATYTGPARTDLAPTALAVTPDGSEIVITGWIQGKTESYLTLAYNTATGAQNWVKKITGLSGSFCIPESIGMSPDGSEVFITGSSYSAASNGPSEYLSVTYQP